MEELNECYNYSIQLISRRDYSRFKLTQKLVQKKYSPETITQAIEKLIDQKYLNEDQYRRIRIKTMLLSGYSENYIINKCAQEQLEVTVDHINSLREDYDLDNENLIDHLIQKKLRSVTIPQAPEEKLKIRNKLFRFLISKGHNYDDFQTKVDIAMGNKYEY